MILQELKKLNEKKEQEYIDSSNKETKMVEQQISSRQQLHEITEQLNKINEKSDKLS